MPFAAALRTSLEARGDEFPSEFYRGDSLEDVLNRHLLTVEQLGGDDVFTCILLLSADGKRLSYGAAPTVPASYCRATESIEIGPFAGSCGAAAYHGRPVYSVDIEKDPVWGNNRSLALQHGFRSCWSTPIRNSHGSIIGTFAILHRRTGKPTTEEIEAIGLITHHVADAIMWARGPQQSDEMEASSRQAPLLRLVESDEVRSPIATMRALADELESKGARFDDNAAEAEAEAQNLREAGELTRKLVAKLRARLAQITSGTAPH